MERKQIALMDPFKRNILLNQDSLQEMSADGQDLSENLRKVDSIFHARTDSIQLASNEIGIMLEGKDLARN